MTNTIVLRNDAVDPSVHVTFNQHAIRAYCSGSVPMTTRYVAILTWR